MIVFQSCQWSNFQSAKILIDSEYITLAWDPPPVEEANPFQPVVSYKVYYRIHGMDDWIFLGVPADKYLEYTVFHSDLGNGSYDFAVSAVHVYDRESGLHSSLDITSDPTGGWYIIWLRFS